MRYPSLFGCWTLVFCCASGCGSHEVPLTPVTGRVLYRGQPVAGGTIVFSPDRERGGKGPLAWSAIDAQGKYALSTDGQPGVAPGCYRITIAGAPARIDPDAETPATVPSTLPRRYSDPDLSGQLCEVKSGQNNVKDLNLE